jgi:hypothetical protein
MESYLKSYFEGKENPQSLSQSLSQDLSQDLEEEIFNEQIYSLGIKIKEKEKFLKAITKPTPVLFGDELITLHPPAKKSTTSVTITISK